MPRIKPEKRGQKKRKINPVILIITEGSKTEPMYFDNYRTRQTNIDVRIVSNKADGAKTDYTHLLDKAISYKKEEQISIEYGDSTWIVADGDVDYKTQNALNTKNQKLLDARKRAHAKNIEIIISNPCFEFWYLLHFMYSTKHFNDYRSVQAELNKYIPNYEKSKDIYSQLSSYTGKATEHAKQIERSHINNGYSLPFGLDVSPYTDVYKLIEKLPNIYPTT